MAESEPVILTRKGVPVFSVVGIEEADLEAWSLGSNPDFIDLMERFRARGRREGGIPLDEVRRRLGVSRETPEAPRK